ncbi:MAG: DUF1223 domain-containing protein [Pseudomonadota bacterium]
MPNRWTGPLFLTLLTTLLTAPLAARTASETQAQPLELDSGPYQVHLLELYTSEGCSSCPPADRFLREFTDSRDLWERVVPLALHVDYWDYLGWKDPFADPWHTQRQRQYRVEGLARSVYTPGWFLNGEEWRGFFLRQDPPLKNIPAPRLTALVDRRQIEARIETENLKQPVLTVARLGFGLQTQVPRGENRGRLLEHDFVLMASEQVAMVPTDGGYTASLILPLSARPSQREAVAIWVTDGNQQPIQATGGWLPAVAGSASP